MNSPIRLDLEITRKCRYRCGICSVRASEGINEEEASLDELQQKVKEFYNIGGKEVSITGGEPSERGLDFLFNLISFCKKLGLHVRMYSVGYGFQDLESVNILKKAGLDSVYLSLEGRKEADEAYKGIKGSYDVAIRAVDLFLKTGIEVIIHYTPTKLNFKDFPHVVKTAKQLGVKKIRMMAYVQQGRGWDNRLSRALDDEENHHFNCIVDDILKTEKDVQLQFSGVFDINSAGIPSCMTEKRRFVITADGLLIPSFAVRMWKNTDYPDRKFILGDMHTVSLEKAWNSSLLVSARENCNCGLCDACCS